jgi:hypothetical protein
MSNMAKSSRMTSNVSAVTIQCPRIGGSIGRCPVYDQRRPQYTDSYELLDAVDAAQWGTCRVGP